MSSSNTHEDDANSVAVIGMAGRFPGARDIEAFWENLRDGVESVSFFSDEELREAGVGEALFTRPDYVRAKAVLDDVEMFDAQFFGFNPREAEVMDPQHRLFLEAAWEALENAGYDAQSYQGAVGVYAGAGPNYYVLNVFSSPKHVEAVGSFMIQVVNRGDYLPTRVSYELNLTGPSVNVQTACSTSLVAVHMACQSLLHGECDMALAGGVAVTVPQKLGYLYQQGSIASPDGHCRAFDAEAAGTVGGNGLGIVVLKRLADAVEDGDNILAVIKGSAINNDGSLKAGFTAPSVRGQAEVIAEAHALAGVDPESITYLEGHGTATPLGDPIEVKALTQAFRAETEKTGFCALGSVKSNIGHVDTAAGVAGLIKTVLALKHRLIPPSLHFQRPNPKLELDASPFYVNTTLREWQAADAPRRAGVSSFGLGGTNAHAVLEEAPEAESDAAARPYQLLVLSAKTPTALEAATANLSRHLRRNPETNLADAAYTLQVGRRAFECRRALVCRDVGDAAAALEAPDARRVFSGQTEPGETKVAFMFPGQGAQYVGMGAELYETEAVFRAHVDECAELLKGPLGLDLRTVLYPAAGREEEAERQLGQTALIQPALFVIETGLARLLMEWGIRPHALIGHSLGEYVAAHVAGVLSLRDALLLIAERGRLLQTLPQGASLSIPLAAEEARAFLNDRVSLAAINAPGFCVASGPVEEISDLEKRLEGLGVNCRLLRTSVATHSAMLEPILDDYARVVGRVRLNAPALPYVSNVTGNWITAEEATDPAYWVKHMRQTVRFADGLRELMTVEDCVLLEVGPGQTLGTFARQAQGPAGPHPVLTSMRHPKERHSDVVHLLNTLGKLWVAGVGVSWPALYGGERRRRVALPTYPFERQRYWVERRFVAAAAAQTSANEEAEGARRDTAAPKPEAYLHARANLPGDYVAPRNNLEQALAEVWQDLLGIEQVGVEDNFFELGGHSLLATQVVARIQDIFGAQVSLDLIFERPTVAEQAVAVEEILLADLDELSEEEAEALLASEFGATS
ncbi:MAG TPA: beta-ketoacyl synthase N-terminal-like domain-containing protein [Pyrinomonadaceae bacterium]|nr:beta-ketoacyl synthase N-terminal-like domain-containing protein [Pyrinomonadaceae bacterium]